MDRIAIALAPDLGIRVQDFIDAWNASEESRPIAVAKADRGEAEHFEPVSLTAVLIGMAAGVTTNVLSELTKKALENKRPGTRVEVREITRSDNSRLFVVTPSVE